MVSAQLGYAFRSSLTGITDIWHTIILPDSFYAKTTRERGDLRVIGINQSGDTLEIPYFFKDRVGDKTASVAFKMLNKTHNTNGFYYTFELPISKTINEIALNFEDINFDWNVDLEGSFNQKEWFTILKDNRIVAFENTESHYRYTKLTFPRSQYHYFRLCVKSEKEPHLTTAELNEVQMIPPQYRAYNLQNVDIQQDKYNKKTIINVFLKSPVPVSNMLVEMSDSIDYLRNIALSINTSPTKVPYFTSIYYGQLSSLQSNNFTFNETIAKNFQLIIYNKDNAPLTLKRITFKGEQTEIIARFTEKAFYYLVYGDKTAHQPTYDIENFKNTIPSNISPLIVGAEEQIASVQTPSKSFVNKYFLWFIMASIMLVLCWQTWKMMKNR